VDGGALIGLRHRRRRDPSGARDRKGKDLSGRRSANIPLAADRDGGGRRRAQDGRRAGASGACGGIVERRRSAGSGRGPTDGRTRPQASELFHAAVLRRRTLHASSRHPCRSRRSAAHLPRHFGRPARRDPGESFILPAASRRSAIEPPRLNSRRRSKFPRQLRGCERIPFPLSLSLPRRKPGPIARLHERFIGWQVIAIV